ncbi:cytochrome P450 [Sporodiniella umbellata]|nr:cytochrome P450 [Sporodiniella umbellata]
MSYFEKISLSLGVLAVSFILTKSTFLYFKKEEIPVVPYKLPLLGSTLDYCQNNTEFVKRWSEKYGSLFRVHLHGGLKTVVGGEDAVEVLKHPGLNFATFHLDFIHAVMGNKKAWTDIQQFNPIMMKNLGPYVEVYNSRCLNVFKKQAEAILGHGTVLTDLVPFLQSIVSRYTVCAFFGQGLSEDREFMDTFEMMMGDAKKQLSPNLLRVLFPRINTLYLKFIYRHTCEVEKHRSVIKTAICEKIQKCQSGSEKEISDMLGHIIASYTKEEMKDPEFSKDMTTKALVLSFVGQWGTLTVLSLVMYRLLQHPEYIQALMEEQESLEGTGSLSDDYRQRVRLDSFIRETLRMRSNDLRMPHVNITKEKIVLRSGVVVRPREEVYINMYYSHIQGIENPLEFQGFRFVGQNMPASQPSILFTQFGIGRNACPARWFAIQQIKAIVSFFLKQYTMTPVGEITVPGIDSNSQKISGAVYFEKK